MKLECTRGVQTVCIGGDIALNGKPILELQSIICHMESHLPPDTGEHAPPLPQPDRPVLNLPTPEG